ncbi:MAG: hypothetical protein VYE22_36385 [Myxococcota bacterium]|nr:hypothetical protein [Myxococcota bacterium]
MTTSLETWLAYEQELHALGERVAAVYASWHEGAPAQLDRLHADLRKLLGRAATALPARGPVAEWTNAALDELGPEPTRRAAFALAVLQHRRQFPAVYLRALVRAAARIGYGGESALLLASHAHGTERVLRAMVEAARDGLYGPREAHFLLYYVRSRRWGGEDRSDPDACRALVDELYRLLPLR